METNAEILASTKEIPLPDKSQQTVRGPSFSQPEAHGPEALHQLVGEFSEMREYIVYYLSLRIEEVKETLRGLVLNLVFMVLGLLTAISILVVSIVYLCNGLASGLSKFFVEAAWLGNIIAGLVLLGSLVLIVLGISAFMKKKSLEGKKHEYAQREQQQKSKLGHSVSERAEPAS